MSGAIGRTSEAPEAAPEPRYVGEFAGQLEAWGGAHRVIVATLALAVLVAGVGWWPTAVVGPYLAVAVATLMSARRNPRSISETPLGTVLLTMDVLTVGALAYAWGTSVSPVTWMNVPIVLGWTLVTRRDFGRLALIAVLALTAALLLAEQLALLPTAPASQLATQVTGQQRLFFFGCLAVALGAGHVLVSEVVERLAEHATLLSRIDAERRMRAKEDELAARLEQTQSLQALGRLAGGIAHDFNNLLMGISGQAELADLRVEREPERAREALRELLSQTHRAGRLTSRLLDYARAQPREPVSTDVAALVTERRALLEQVLGAQMRLSVRGEPRCWVHIDPAELSRLLVNIAANATDATEGKGELSIRISRQDDEVRLRLRDDGAGIAPEHLPRVFDPFFTTKPPGEAPGLGLSAVFGIVRRSGGQVSLESTAGSGTTVTVHWPAAQPPDPASQRPPPPDVRKPAGGPPAGPLLLVDDDEAVRSVVQAQLEEAGYHVEALADGRAALDAALATPAGHYRLLITDVRMPGMGGAELAAAFTNHSPQTPVLFVSGYADDSLGDAARFGPLLEKPFSTARLLEAVRDALKHAAEQA